MTQRPVQRRFNTTCVKKSGSIRLGGYATGGLLRPKKKECLVRLSSVSKSYKDCLFEGVDLSIETGDRVGLIGANGSGKTTLLKIMVGEVEPDSGTVHMKPNLAFSHVTQVPALDRGSTLMEAVMSGIPRLEQIKEEMHSLLEGISNPSLNRDGMEDLLAKYSELDDRYRLIGGYDAESRATMILNGLGLGREKLDQAVDTLSGGEKTRAMIAKSLVVEPELLLLDEPTNHLDIDCMKWLEGFLRTVNCAYVIISHDRSFLDATVEKTLEIEAGKIASYPGNYTKYKELKARSVATQTKDYELQQRKIRREEELIRFLKTKGMKKQRQAKSREKLLAKMERIEKPFKQREVRILLKPEFQGAEEALKVVGLSKAFDGLRLFTDLSFTLRRGEKMGLIGPNGSGKTTLIRIFTGAVKPDTGEVKFGAFVSPSNYDQELTSLNQENTILQEACEADPHRRPESIRTLLAAFLFRGETVKKKVSKLSGGEKGRLAVAKLVISGSNFLLLDEPTNHLDLRSREILEEALKTYSGTVILASHDRRLINNVCNRLLVFGDGDAFVFNAGYRIYELRSVGINPSP